MNVARIVRLIAFLCLTNLCVAHADDKLHVLNSIYPIHLITQDILGEYGTSSVLISTAQDMHHFSLRPSHLKLIKEADTIVRVSPLLESYLDKLIVDKPLITWVNLSGIHQLPVSEAHDHHHDHGHHHDYHSLHNASHPLERKAIDPHIWLHPNNAVILIDQLAIEFSRQKPHHADHFRENAHNLKQKLSQLDKNIRHDFAHSNLSYGVFHDAWRYFQDAYHINSPHSIPAKEGISPSLYQVKTLRKHLQQERIHCLLAPVNSNSKLINTLIENTETNIVLMDAFGQQLPKDQHHYPGLLRHTYIALKPCRGKRHVH